MNSKEKAKELVDKYADNLPRIWYNVVEGKNYHSAKQCAIIAVDELLNHCYEVMKPFWEEVKLEIEKL